MVPYKFIIYLITYFYVAVAPIRKWANKSVIALAAWVHDLPRGAELFEHVLVC